MVNITHARIDKGLKQAELAKLCGISPSAVSQWEAGEKTPRRENLEKMASVLGVTVEYLMGKENDPAQIDMDRVDMALLKELQDLTPTERQKTHAFIAGLKANREG